MAIYILQPLIDRVLGSRGGVTFQRCGQQFSIRNRAKPVLKKTKVSQAVRNVFGSIQSNWRTLSTPNQTTFEDAAPNFLRVDSIGNPYEIKAINLFGSANLSLVAQEQPQIVNIPLFGSPFANGTITDNFDISALTWQVRFIVNPTPADYFYSILAGESMTDNNVDPDIRTLKVIKRFDPTDSTLVNIAADLKNAFPSLDLSPGRYIPVAGRVTEIATGQITSVYRSHALIVP